MTAIFEVVSKDENESEMFTSPYDPWELRQDFPETSRRITQPCKLARWVLEGGGILEVHLCRVPEDSVVWRHPSDAREARESMPPFKRGDVIQRLCDH